MGNINTAALHKVTRAAVLVRAVALGGLCSQPHTDAPVKLLPWKAASATTMDTARKHTQVAKSDLSTEVCTASNHCNHIFVENVENRAGRNFKRPLAPSLPQGEL